MHDSDKPLQNGSNLVALLVSNEHCIELYENNVTVDCGNVCLSAITSDNVQELHEVNKCDQEVWNEYEVVNSEFGNTNVKNENAIISTDFINDAMFDELNTVNDRPTIDNVQENVDHIFPNVITVPANSDKDSSFDNTHMIYYDVGLPKYSESANELIITMKNVDVSLPKSPTHTTKRCG